MSSATPQLEGISVLDLSSVGPAARASRMLADYGAAVVKVGPTARKGAVQVRPPFHTYGAGRGIKRIQIDLDNMHTRLQPFKMVTPSLISEYVTAVLQINPNVLDAI